MNHETAVKGELGHYVESQSAPSPHDTIGTKIRRYAETQPERPALVSSGFEPLSYRDLQHQIDTVRAALRRAGLGRNARIVVAMPNGPQAAMAIVAVSCAAVSVPVNPRQTFAEVERCLATVRPDGILLIKGDDSVARQAAETSGVKIVEAVQSNAGFLRFDNQDASTAEILSEKTEHSGPDALAFIFQTSGTSGEPKLIPFSHGNMLAAATRLQTWYKLKAQDCCLSVTPLFYSHGLKVTVFTPLLSGGTVAFPADASKFDYLEWFGRLKPTWYSAGPTLHRLVFDQIKSRAGTITDNSLRFVVSGGAPLPRDILEGLQHSLGVPVVEQYGTSEAAVVATNSPPPDRSKPGTCGVPWPDTVMIVNENGAPSPPGERGEILLRGPTLISGYLDAPELNQRSFSDGWFSTGDIGSLDADGFLTIHGRKTEFINRGGEKISPGDVDQALLSHPAVADAAAFSISHPRLGQDVAAAVVLHPGMNASSFELRRYLLDKLASFKVPRRIVIRSSLPKGASGKVVRRRLSESWQDERETAAQFTSETIDGRFVELAIQITAIWERLLETSPLALDDDFFEQGGDSLLAVNMLTELAKLTGKDVPDSMLLDASTIRQLTQKLYDRDKSEPKYLAEINPGGCLPPLIFFHGHFHLGGTYVTVTLSKLLGSDQPMLVVAPHADNETIPDSIEAMAAERLPLILKAQPEGPYRLSGICLGGLVAFETARLLIAAGKKVEWVAMIDSPTINANKFTRLLLSMISLARPLTNKADHARAWTWHKCVDLQRAWNVSWARKWAAVKRRVGGLLGAKTVEVSEISLLGEFSNPRSAKYATAMSNYRPKPLAVPVVYMSVDYVIGAWTRISPNFETIKAPGDHRVLDLPKIAEILSARMARENNARSSAVRGPSIE